MTSNTRSRAVVLPAFGQPLVVDEFDVPPADDGAIVVAVAYGGVCGTDLHLQRGHLDVPTPFVLGHEGFGTMYGSAAVSSTTPTGPRSARVTG
jgi:D-arabinose 1-dehydrogenase-like Zn-dependent alcohol dehydrogenase